MMHRILIFIIGFILVQNFVHAQDSDTLSKPQGIKIGLDLGRYVNMALREGLIESEGQIDVNIKKRYFAVFEGGYGAIERDFNIYNPDSTTYCGYHYKSSGGFGRIGFDFNTLKTDNINSVTLGLRIGGSTQKHYANNIQYHDAYWGNTAIPLFPSQQYYTLWAEVVLGLRVELFKNVFVGWNARGKLVLAKTNNDDFKPYLVPGFGDLNTKTNLGFNYYLLYRIPFKK